ncbi:MAG: 2-hydroxymuconate tautomerase family protein [Syntrophomonadaceae bacterium]|nr:2-hydroxymuconate tautomerase family protein [Syntrophomonadaceae bacterium]MDD3899177.1 2-hydroxymuconate tautomerase family protein [Syntrophomonadaceae bacterium]MDD4562502.1 2-hydroxymuconate tautomerase family protein [Syntrophomonadaceae bacterium]
MPIINVQMIAGRSQEKKQELVAVLTSETARILDVEPDWVTVVINEYTRDNWASGGELHSIKLGEGFGRQGT